MKSLLLIALFSFSSMAFSATSVEIRDAIGQSLVEHELICKNSNYEQYFVSSDLDLSGLEDYQATISENSQPGISFYNQNDEHAMLVEVFTDSSFTVVKKLTINAYKLSMVKTNVGTLIAPVFKIVQKKELLYTTECK